MSNHKQVAVVHNLTSGGSVRVMEQLNRKLEKYFELKYFAPKKYQQNANQVLRILNYLKYIYFDLPREYEKIAKSINKINPAAVIVHPDAYIKAPPIFSKIRSKSIYFLNEPPRELYEPLSFHAPRMIDKFFTLLRFPIKFIDYKNAKNAKIVISNSKFSKNIIRQIYSKSSTVIYPGCSTEFKPRDTKNKKNYVISIGSLLPYKGHELTIRAISKLQDKPKFVIVGSGRDYDKKIIYDLSKRLGVNVEIHADINDFELSKLLNKSMAYINSAYKEPFGISSLEALLSGTFLITVNNCGTTEMAEYFKHNIIITKRNVNELARAINKVQKSRLHEEVILPKVFDWHYIGEKVKSIIDDD